MPHSQEFPPTQLLCALGIVLLGVEKDVPTLSSRIRSYQIKNFILRTCCLLQTTLSIPLLFCFCSVCVCAGCVCVQGVCVCVCALPVCKSRREWVRWKYLFCSPHKMIDKLKDLKNFILKWKNNIFRGSVYLDI